MPEPRRSRPSRGTAALAACWLWSLVGETVAVAVIAAVPAPRSRRPPATPIIITSTTTRTAVAEAMAITMSITSTCEAAPAAGARYTHGCIMPTTMAAVACERPPIGTHRCSTLWHRSPLPVATTIAEQLACSRLSSSSSACYRPTATSSRHTCMLCYKWRHWRPSGQP